MRTLFLMLFMLAFRTIAQSQNPIAYGVMINVPDLEKAHNFYCNILGFEVETKTFEYILLKNEGTQLILKKVAHFLPEREKDTKVSFTLQVNDLDSKIAYLKAKGISFEGVQKRKEGVGYAIYIMDPFGKRISLMHQTITKVEPFDEPRIYNYGFYIPDMNSAIDFYCTTLGLTQGTQKYLPLDMPLYADKSFAFMLHYREGLESIISNSPDTQHIVILFKTANLDQTIGSLKSKGVKFLQPNPRQSFLGRSISFYNPFGYLSELIEIK